MSAKGPLIYRQKLATRVTHWLWAISFFFLLLTGLQIFNAHPILHIGQESGFAYDNTILSITATAQGASLRGQTTILGQTFDTTGFLGAQGTTDQAIPAALTIPSTRNLATGRVIHFFFAWVLAASLALWFVTSAVNGHLRQVVPTLTDLRHLPADIAAHARLRFHHTAAYNPLQKLAYAGVLFILLPLMILTGLSMSPAINAAAPWMLDLFGGRQTARTLHFLTMLALVSFFLIHMLMILAAGPLNELRSILSGWYRTDKDPQA